MTDISLTAADWIDRLELLPHPEGGFYAETYRGAEMTGTDRAVSTGIHFLLRADDVSHFHRIDADEMWHFYAGSPLTVHMIDPDGRYSRFILGPNPDAGHCFQAVVPARYWFGAALESDTGYALVGCTVAPGFEFAGFELAEREALTNRYPKHAAIIKRLTPPA